MEINHKHNNLKGNDTKTKKKTKKKKKNNKYKIYQFLKKKFLKSFQNLQIKKKSQNQHLIKGKATIVANPRGTC